MGFILPLCLRAGRHVSGHGHDQLEYDPEHRGGDVLGIELDQRVGEDRVAVALLPPVLLVPHRTAGVHRSRLFVTASVACLRGGAAPEKPTAHVPVRDPRKISLWGLSPRLSVKSTTRCASSWL